MDWLIYDNGLRRSILDSKIHLSSLFLLAILVNVIGDYFSLLKTRVLLRIIRRHKFALEIAIFADAILTGLLFLFGLWLTFVFLGFSSAPFRSIQSSTAAVLAWNRLVWVGLGVRYALYLLLLRLGICSGFRALSGSGGKLVGAARYPRAPTCCQRDDRQQREAR